MFYCSPIFHAKHIMSTGTLTLFVFCLYPCFVSVVQIFPHKSQRDGLSVHVNFCVGSLLHSRFIITIVTFYCRIGKSLYQLISVLSPICPIKHIITYLAPSCLVGSVAGYILIYSLLDGRCYLTVHLVLLFVILLLNLCAIFLTTYSI